MHGLQLAGDLVFLTYLVGNTVRLREGYLDIVETKCYGNVFDNITRMQNICAKNIHFTEPIFS